MSDNGQTLADDSAIRRVTAYYSDAVTHLDADRAASVYCDDGCVVITGNALHGRDAIAAGMRQSFAEFSLLRLIAHGGVIAIADDTANARWSTLELTIRRNSEQLNVIFGRYEDALVRQPEGWRFARRVFTIAGRTQLDTAKVQFNPLFLAALDPSAMPWLE